MLTPPCYVTTKLQGLQRRQPRTPVTETFALPCFYEMPGLAESFEACAADAAHKKRRTAESAIDFYRRLIFRAMLKFITWRS
jgi:hypothetical protein